MIMDDDLVDAIVWLFVKLPVLFVVTLVLISLVMFLLEKEDAIGVFSLLS